MWSNQRVSVHHRLQPSLDDVCSNSLRLAYIGRPVGTRNSLGLHVIIYLTLGLELETVRSEDETIFTILAVGVGCGGRRGYIVVRVITTFGLDYERDSLATG